LFGRPNTADVQRIVTELDGALPRGVLDRFLVDARRLDQGPVDFEAGLVGARWMERHAGALQTAVSKVAVLAVPSEQAVSIVGMMTLGPVSIRAFQDPREALRWLAPEIEPGRFFGSLAERLRAAVRASPLLSLLR